MEINNEMVWFLFINWNERIFIDHYMEKGGEIQFFISSVVCLFLPLGVGKWGKQVPGIDYNVARFIRSLL